MKRRSFIKGMVAASAAAVPATRTAFPQQPEFPTQTPTPTPTPAPPAPAAPPSPPPPGLPKVDFTVPDLAAQPSLRFFSRDQFATLQKLSDIIVPSMPGNPGALEAGVPEFLDFLIGASPAGRRQIYQEGLDRLNKESIKRFNKPFAIIETAEIAVLLAPLREPWTFEPPKDPIARLLREAKVDVMRSTRNSREWSHAPGRDPEDALNFYWYPIG